eukprot:8536073-Pyramimonas_sp.AAC.1
MALSCAHAASTLQLPFCPQCARALAAFRAERCSVIARMALSCKEDLARCAVTPTKHVSCSTSPICFHAPSRSPSCKRSDS